MGLYRTVLAVLLLCAAMPAISVSGLHTLARPHGIAIGAAVDVPLLNTDPAYASLLAHEFNMVTPENAMKFSVVHPERERYDFSQADALMAFAEAHGMQVHGHVLVWHNQLPEWLSQGVFTHDELKAILREHIQTLVTRYRGRITWWDVAAEAVGEDGRMAETFWSRGIGPDYLQLAFRWAHEADPEARLLYNDYGAEGAGAKSDGVYNLMAELRQKGVPVHGVGLQMHVSLDEVPDVDDVRINMKRLAALNLETHITEMDVMLHMPMTQHDLEAQAKVYRDMLRTCLTVLACRSFSTWGVADRYSWIPEFFPGYGAALLFDAGLRPKPAAAAVRRLLR